MSNFLKYKYRLFSSNPTSGSSPAGLEARVTNLENNEYKVTYYEIITGTSGTIVPPTGATFSSGEFGLSGNAILSKIDVANKPTFETPTTLNGSLVTASLDTSTGVYITSGAYTDASVALIYSFTIKALVWSNVNQFYVIEYTSGNELVTDYVQFNTNATVSIVPGRTGWNNTDGVSETTLKGGSVVLKNGVDLVARVVNKVVPNTTLTKSAYQVVKVSGAQGQRLAVNLAQANNDNNSADTLGLVIETIATNQEGFIMTVGQLEEINTTGSLQGEIWVDGDVLYLSPTTPGAITNVKPNGSTGHIIVLGYVEYSHAIHGKIYVKIMNGWELDELHNVYINPLTLADNDVLAYENSTSLWKNKSISAISTGLVPYVTSTSNVNLDNTTSSSTGIITKNSNRFLHNFKHPTGSTAIPTGNNTMLGELAGNFTMGSTATSTFQASNNTFIGYNTGNANTLGYSNSFLGTYSGQANTTGYSNVFLGTSAGQNNTTGYFNIFIGDRAGQLGSTSFNNVFIGTLAGNANTGSSNSFFGYYAASSNTSGSSNVGFGSGAGGLNTTGSNNLFVGANSGGYLADGTTANQTSGNSLFIGVNTRALSAGNTNQIVIGHGVIGAGSNTVTIGSSSITDNYLSGFLKVTGNTKTYSTGTITNQYFNYLTTNTLAFVGASTASNCYALYVEKATAGTNATITNNFGIGTNAGVFASGGKSIFNPTTYSDTGLFIEQDEYGNTTTQCNIKLQNNNFVKLGAFYTGATYSGEVKLYQTGNTLLTRIMAVGTSYLSQSNLVIGSSTAVASAMLNIDSTTKGFLPPRMTTTEKNAISSPAAGLIVYDTTTNKACCYNGSTWNDLF